MDVQPDNGSGASSMDEGAGGMQGVIVAEVQPDNGSDTSMAGDAVNPAMLALRCRGLSSLTGDAAAPTMLALRAVITLTLPPTARVGVVTV